MNQATEMGRSPYLCLDFHVAVCDAQILQLSAKLVYLGKLRQILD